MVIEISFPLKKVKEIVKQTIKKIKKKSFFLNFRKRIVLMKMKKKYYGKISEDL